MKQQLDLGPEFSVNVFTRHRRIIEALCERNPVKAREEMLAHIKQVEQDLIANSDEDFPFYPNPDKSELKNED